MSHSVFLSCVHSWFSSGRVTRTVWAAILCLSVLLTLIGAVISKDTVRPLVIGLLLCWFLSFYILQDRRQPSKWDCKTGDRHMVVSSLLGTSTYWTCGHLLDFGTVRSPSTTNALAHQLATDVGASAIRSGCRQDHFSDQDVGKYNGG